GLKIALGPVVGHVGTDHAILWLRAAGNVSLPLDIAILEEGRRDSARRERATFFPIGRGFGNVRIDGLKAGTAYQVGVKAPDDEKPARLSFRTPPAPAAHGKVRFGVGSCANFGKHPVQPVWDQVAKDDLDLFLFLGDNCYYGAGRTDGSKDWENAQFMIERHVQTRSQPNLLASMRRMANYAVWDDHDFGPNDCDRFFPLRAESRAVHRMMWANPAYGENDEGVYHSFRWGPAEFFMLDDRSFKDTRAAVAPAERTLYGARQMAWLRAGVKASTAVVKFIAGGVQHLVDLPAGEGWRQAPVERAEFLAWVRREKITGIVFLSGDVHYSELLHRDAGAGAADLVEITSSGLANETPAAAAKLLAALKITGRRWMVPVANYCAVELDVPAAPKTPREGRIVFQCFASATGKKEAETTFDLSTLLDIQGD
ncbi:MAG: alkaline phosphatase family protein, partial [Planctomycetes bacterium]|nr:alkaline phosphatase family protein [Planctomycetota bacterium]